MASQVLLLYLIFFYYFQASAAFGSSSSSTSKRVFLGIPAPKHSKLISECMTPINNLGTLSESSTVDEAVQLLLRLGVSGAPVVHDATGELVGIVSSFDFLQQEAGEGSLLPIEGSKETIESYLGAAKKICAKKVGDLMTTDITTLESSESMRMAASLMSSEKLHRLPIVDNGKLVGMLTSSDIMFDLVRVAQNLPPGDDNQGENASLIP
mmetsp:Transcript_7523/g.8273  ORF Transcript_7523/g.8273 Transcript_7523/m.8273 type:complete len:210 (-) Transcript_7523:223-852(-)